MFLNIKVLTKLMKKSYKGVGLFIGYDQGNFIISNNTIAATIDEDGASNAIKAAFVEYLGYIPTTDCYFFVQKDIPNPQSRMTEADELFEMIGKYRDAELKAYATPLRYFGSLLCQDVNGNVFGIDEGYLQMIDKSMIDYGNESEPTGPCYIYSPADGVYWHNDYCTLIVRPTEMHDQKRLSILGNLEYHKKDSEKNAAEKE